MKKGSGGKLTNLQSFIISSLFLITVIVLMNSISDLESFIWFFVGIILVLFGLFITIYFLVNWLLEYSWVQKVKKSFTKLNILVIFLILSISFGFYWFTIRSSIIKKECSQIASENARGSGTIGSGAYANNKNLSYITIYEACKAERGI